MHFKLARFAENKFQLAALSVNFGTSGITGLVPSI
jgi:hypothetical protein